MKQALIIILSLYCSFSLVLRNDPISTGKTVNECETIVDSAKFLMKNSDIGVNSRPVSFDTAVFFRLNKWLRLLPYNKLTCLLNSNDISAKAFGFLYGADIYPDSVYKNYSYLLADTTEITIFSVYETDSLKMKLGVFLTGMNESLKQDHADRARQPEVEKTVLDFIRRYATYPESYRPISFPHFSMGSAPREPVNFWITHSYQIKNNREQTVDEVSAFAVDHNMHINAIEKDSTLVISADPPKLDYWFKEFGRPLTGMDSSALLLHGKFHD